MRRSSGASSRSRARSMVKRSAIDFFSPRRRNELTPTRVNPSHEALGRMSSRDPTHAPARARDRIRPSISASSASRTDAVGFLPTASSRSSRRSQRGRDWGGAKALPLRSTTRPARSANRSWNKKYARPWRQRRSRTAAISRGEHSAIRRSTRPASEAKCRKSPAPEKSVGASG